MTVLYIQCIIQQFSYFVCSPFFFTILSNCTQCNQNSSYIIPSKLEISEPEFVDDPAAVATLTVQRSAGGEGAVTLVWQVEGQDIEDLYPTNGTLVFTEVQQEKKAFFFCPRR